MKIISSEILSIRTWKFFHTLSFPVFRCDDYAAEFWSTGCKRKEWAPLTDLTTATSPRDSAFPVSEENSEDPEEEDCKVEKVRVPEGHRTVSPLTHVLV